MGSPVVLLPPIETHDTQILETSEAVLNFKAAVEEDFDFIGRH